MRSCTGVALWRAAILVTILCAGVAVQPASASLITETFNFSASGFRGAPVDPVIGSFTLTFDPTVSVLNNTATGITLNNINIGLNPASIEFKYDAANQQTLFIGNGFLGPNTLGVFAGHDQFLASFTSAGGNAPTMLGFDYSQSGFSTIFTFASGTVAVTSVPEPSSLLLLATGLLVGLGIARRRRSA